MNKSILVMTLGFLLSSQSAAIPFWGETESSPLDTPPFMLRPGQFIWKGDAIPKGPIVVVVSLQEQRVYIYRNGIRIGVPRPAQVSPVMGHLPVYSWSCKKTETTDPRPTTTPPCRSLNA